MFVRLVFDESWDRSRTFLVNLLIWICETSLWWVIGVGRFWFDCFYVLVYQKFCLSLTLCDIANINNIYEFVNFVFVILNEVTNISNIYKLVLVCLRLFSFKFFFFFLVEKSFFFSWCTELWNMEIMKLFFFLICNSWVSPLQY